MWFHFIKRVFRFLVVKVYEYTGDVVITLKSPIYIFAIVFSTVSGTGVQWMFVEGMESSLQLIPTYFSRFIFYVSLSPTPIWFSLHSGKIATHFPKHLSCFPTSVPLLLSYPLPGIIFSHIPDYENATVFSSQMLLPSWNFYWLSQEKISPFS